MPRTINEIISIMRQFSDNMTGLRADFNTITEESIERFLEETTNVSNQMRHQGRLIFGMNCASAGFAMLGALLTPQTPSNRTTNPSVNVRLNAQDGLKDLIHSFANKLRDNEFLSSTCKTSSQFFSGLTPVVQSSSQAVITEGETKRSLLKEMQIQQGQAGKSYCDGQTQQINSLALNLLQTAARAA